MNPQDPLANLHPLRTPEGIHWWPPAPGWWLLAALLLTGLAAAIYFALQYWRRDAYRRQATRQLAALQRAYTQHGNAARFVTETNALLKSVALHAYPAADVASQHGDKWASFLNANNNSSKPEHHFDSDWFAAIYQPATETFDADRLHKAATHWIKHHRVNV